MRDIQQMKPPRRQIGYGRKVVRVVGAVVMLGRDVVGDDVRMIVRNGKLFFGLTFLIVGLLSFVSDRYCDGNVSSYYACTRPETYYYYPWWAILLILVGSSLIVLWRLRSKL